MQVLQLSKRARDVSIQLVVAQVQVLKMCELGQGSRDGTQDVTTRECNAVEICWP